tara:strand:+ start:2110 stop:2304 length:195 start_codon:yes stop_codon:yes gene_type:complete
MNFLTPMSENLLLLSEDFRGGMARGLEPDSGFVSCVCVCVRKNRDTDQKVIVDVTKSARENWRQ